jgi:hypothetical protein
MLTTCLRLPTTSSWLCSGRHDHHCYVPSASAVRQIPGDVSRRDVERWLSEWRISINAMLFFKAGRRISKLRRVKFFGEPIQWFDTARYLGVIFEKRLTWSTHIDQVRKKAAQRLGVLGPLLNRRSSLSNRNGVLLYIQLIRPMTTRAPSGGPRSLRYQETAGASVRV